MQLVLASQSPRRKELLGLLGRDFITLPVDCLLYTSDAADD